MHIIQEKLLALSKKENLAKLSLRKMADKAELPGNSPQKIKHHLLQLQKKGFLLIDRERGIMKRTILKSSLSKGLLNKKTSLFSIPIIGFASCGLAEIFAEENFQGFLKISSKLANRSNPNGLYAIKTSGSSMNRAEIKGKKIEDGDFVIIDSKDRNPKTDEIVLVIIDDRATLKRFRLDKRNEQVVLKSDSSFDYEPICLHPDDEFFINGKAVAVIKKFE